MSHVGKAAAGMSHAGKAAGAGGRKRKAAGGGGRKVAAGGGGRKVAAAPRKKALTLAQKRERVVTGKSLGRCRSTYKMVHGDWPMVDAMYLSDMRSPSTLRPVLLVHDPLKRYFESPHGSGKQEILPDRVRNSELRRLLGEKPKDLDTPAEHLRLVRKAEMTWERCPISYAGARPAIFNDKNYERDRKIDTFLLQPLKALCAQRGLPPVLQQWMFHCPSDARGAGYYSGRWGNSRTLKYTDDKLFMTAYRLFCEKYAIPPRGFGRPPTTPPAGAWPSPGPTTATSPRRRRSRRRCWRAGPAWWRLASPS